MKIQNLEGLMVSASEVKKELPEIMSNKLTKVIVKNNVPVSVIVPYSEYIALNENAEENKAQLTKFGQDIVMKNGVQVMVTAGIGNSDDLVTTAYIKMKTTGDYKLLHTFSLSAPSPEMALTIDEINKFCFENLD